MDVTLDYLLWVSDAPGEGARITRKAPLFTCGGFSDHFTLLEEKVRERGENGVGSDCRSVKKG
jgi:hypothetical protein